MFNGIIKYTGKVIKILKNKNECFINIKSKLTFSKNEIGSSISCSGACLTLIKFNKKISHFYIKKGETNN